MERKSLSSHCLCTYLSANLNNICISQATTAKFEKGGWYQGYYILIKFYAERECTKTLKMSLRVSLPGMHQGKVEAQKYEMSWNPQGPPSWILS